MNSSIIVWSAKFNDYRDFVAITRLIQKIPFFGTRFFYPSHRHGLSSRVNVYIIKGVALINQQKFDIIILTNQDFAVIFPPAFDIEI